MPGRALASMPISGKPGAFSDQPGPWERFRFGREMDGTPTAPWSWDDPDYDDGPLAWALLRAGDAARIRLAET